MQGHNLTVREIKDRLNEVFLLHSSLSRRDKLDSDVKTVTQITSEIESVESKLKDLNSQ